MNLEVVWCLSPSHILKGERRKIWRDPFHKRESRLYRDV